MKVKVEMVWGAYVLLNGRKWWVCCREDGFVLEPEVGLPSLNRLAEDSEDSLRDTLEPLWLDETCNLIVVEYSL